MSPLSIRLSSASSYGIATYPPGATFGPRRLEDWEFVLLLQGDAVYTRDGVDHPAPEGALVLCQPQTTDFFRWDPDHATRHAFFHFHLSGQPDASLGDPAGWPVVRPSSADDIVKPMFLHLLTWAGRGDPALSELSMLHLLRAFVLGQTSAADLPDPALPAAVDRALRYIQASLADDPSVPLTLGELSRRARVTPEHLCRLFMTSTGRSPLATVRLARLDHAATLLARSNFAIGEIAELCGFASPYHFSRVFREAFKLSPREVRRRIRSGQTPPISRLLTHRHRPGGV